MSFASQKTIRGELVAKLKTIPQLADQGATVHVVGAFQPDPAGISPFCCIESLSASYDYNGDEGNLTSFDFLIGFWVRKDSAGDTTNASVVAAEDLLDDLAKSLADLLKTNYNAKQAGKPTSDHEIINGIPYKFALHFVSIDY